MVSRYIVGFSMVSFFMFRVVSRLPGSIIFVRVGLLLNCLSRRSSFISDGRTLEEIIFFWRFGTSPSGLGLESGVKCSRSASRMLMLMTPSFYSTNGLLFRQLMVSARRRLIIFRIQMFAFLSKNATFLDGIPVN